MTNGIQANHVLLAVVLLRGLTIGNTAKSDGRLVNYGRQYHMPFSFRLGSEEGWLRIVCCDISNF